MRLGLRETARWPFLKKGLFLLEGTLYKVCQAPRKKERGKLPDRLVAGVC
jgi:hypothetical protein